MTMQPTSLIPATTRKRAMRISMPRLPHPIENIGDQDAHDADADQDQEEGKHARFLPAVRRPAQRPPGSSFCPRGGRLAPAG